MYLLSDSVPLSVIIVSVICSIPLPYSPKILVLQVILSSSFAHILPLSLPLSLPPTILSPRPSHLSLRPLHPKKKQRWIDADRRNRIRAKCESAVKIILLEITAATDGAVVCVCVSVGVRVLSVCVCARVCVCVREQCSK